MNLLWIVGSLGAALIGFVTAWRWTRDRAQCIEQSLEMRLRLRERDLRLAEERLRRLEAERWRPAASTSMEAASAEPVEVDADGLPKRPIPAAVQAELIGLQHRCELQQQDIAALRRDLVTRAGEVALLRGQLDVLSRHVESGEQGDAGR